MELTKSLVIRYETVGDEIYAIMECDGERFGVLIADANGVKW